MNFSIKCAVFLGLFSLMNINATEKLTQKQRHQRKQVIVKHFKCLKDSEIETLYCSILTRAMKNEKVEACGRLMYQLREKMEKEKTRLKDMQSAGNQYTNDQIEDQKVKISSLEKQYEVSSDALNETLLKIDMEPNQE